MSAALPTPGLTPEDRAVLVAARAVIDRLLEHAGGHMLEVLHIMPGTCRTERSIFSLPGSTGDERALHRRFALARREGEWFELTPEISAYIEALKEATPK